MPKHQSKVNISAMQGVIPPHVTRSYIVEMLQELEILASSANLTDISAVLHLTNEIIRDAQDHSISKLE